MSKPKQIASKAEFDALLKSSTIVVADFYADWCAPCKTIAPLYEQLSVQLSRPNKMTFTKVNVDTRKDVAQAHKVTAMPTFMIFKNGQVVESIRGANPPKLQEAVRKLAAEADAAGGGFADAGGSGSWLAGPLPRGYNNVTDQVDMKGLDLLNAHNDRGTARALFDGGKPSALRAETDKGKGASEDEGSAAAETYDWVESDTDEQLMLYVPFQSTLKVHSIQITSLPASGAAKDNEKLARPKTIKLYINRPNVLGFGEADGYEATQAIILQPQDWNAETGTAKLDLRFVKFQRVYSLVIFVVDGDGEDAKVRIDRIRFIGESGEKRDQGKLEKVGDHD